MLAEFNHIAIQQYLDWAHPYDDVHIEVAAPIDEDIAGFWLIRGGVHQHVSMETLIKEGMAHAGITYLREHTATPLVWTYEDVGKIIVDHAIKTVSRT